jgi:hypothetical protein
MWREEHYWNASVLGRVQYNFQVFFRQTVNAKANDVYRNTSNILMAIPKQIYM